MQIFLQLSPGLQTPAAATISATGLVTAVAVGETTITAMHTSLTSSSNGKISVTATGQSDISLDGKNLKN